MNVTNLLFDLFKPVIGKYLKIPIYLGLGFVLLPMWLTAIASLAGDMIDASQDWQRVKVLSSSGVPGAGRFDYEYRYDGVVRKGHTVFSGSSDEARLAQLLQAARDGTLTVMVNSNHPTESALVVHQDWLGHVLFLGLLLFVTLVAVHRLRSLDQEKQTLVVLNDLDSEQKGQQRIPIIFWSAVLFGSLLMTFHWSTQIEESNAIALLLPLAVAVAALVMLIRALLHWHRFKRIGRTPLQLLSQPIDLQSGVAASFTLAEGGANGMTATLRCYSRMSHTHGSGSDSHTTTVEEDIWQEKRRCQVERLPTGETKVSCQFEPPTQLPGSSALLPSGLVYWQLICRGTYRDADGNTLPLERSWQLPVNNSSSEQPATLLSYILQMQAAQAAKANGSHSADEADDSAANQAAAMMRSSVSYSALDAELAPAVTGPEAEADTSQATTTEAATVEDAEVLRSHSDFSNESVGRWVTLEQQGDGIEIRTQSRRKNKTMPTIFAFMAALIAIDVGRSGDVQAVLIALSPFVAIATLWALFSLLAAKLAVKATPGQLQLSAFRLGKCTSQRAFNIAAEPNIRIEQTSRSGSANKSTQYYKLVLRLDGKSMTLLKNIGNYQDALWLKRRIIEAVSGVAASEEHEVLTGVWGDSLAPYQEQLAEFKVAAEKELTNTFTVRTLENGLEISTLSKQQLGLVIPIMIFALLIMVMAGLVGLFIGIPMLAFAAINMGYQQRCQVYPGKIAKIYAIAGTPIWHKALRLQPDATVIARHQDMLGLESKIGYVTLTLKQASGDTKLVAGYATQKEANTMAERLNHYLQAGAK